MVADTDKARERASEQATDWLILLQDDPDDADLLARFDAWLTESPINVEAWAITDQVAGAINRTPATYADRWQPLLEAYRAGDSGHSSGLSASVPVVSRRRPRSEPRRIRRMGLGFAAAALAACVAVLIVPSAVLHLRADYLTGTAQTRNLTLADGSTVALAPDSAIRVVYGERERRIELISGEAFFTVVHDAVRPFQVATGGVETTDIGTAFDVRRGDDGASVAVQQGSVQVEYRSALPPVSETLRAGQAVRVSWSGAAIRSDEPAGQVAAWRQDQLIAQDAPMREVVDQLRPYFAGTILVTNAALAGRPVTGVYNLADPVEALRGIAQAHGATVRRITPWVLVVSGG